MSRAVVEPAVIVRQVDPVPLRRAFGEQHARLAGRRVDHVLEAELGGAEHVGGGRVEQRRDKALGDFPTLSQGRRGRNRLVERPNDLSRAPSYKFLSLS